MIDECMMVQVCTICMRTRPRSWCTGRGLIHDICNSRVGMEGSFLGCSRLFFASRPHKHPAGYTLRGALQMGMRHLKILLCVLSPTLLFGGVEWQVTVTGDQPCSKEIHVHIWMLSRLSSASLSGAACISVHLGWKRRLVSVCVRALWLV